MCIFFSNFLIYFKFVLFFKKMEVGGKRDENSLDGCVPLLCPLKPPTEHQRLPPHLTNPPLLHLSIFFFFFFFVLLSWDSGAEEEEEEEAEDGLPMASSSTVKPLGASRSDIFSGFSRLPSDLRSPSVQISLRPRIPRKLREHPSLSLALYCGNWHEWVEPEILQ